MPQISHISDATSKSYNTGLNNNRGSEQGGEQFTVAGAPKQEQLQAVSDKNTGSNPQTTMGQKDLIPLAVTTTKNQTLAVETVKDIINADLLNTAKLNGYTELVGELERLGSSLYIPASSLVKEILEQEKQNTMFSGDKFYDLLREAAKGANEDLKEAIGNMLKAINFAQNRNEITTAVSANLRFLAEYFSPNRNLSKQLSDLADLWGRKDAGDNFGNLRNQTSDLLRSLSDSLLNDSHTQTLIPIVTHNLSKYNTNSAMLREYFGQLLSQIPSYEERNKLASAFEGLLSKLLKDNSLNNYTISGEKNQVENTNFSREYQTDSLISSYLTENLSKEDYLEGLGLSDSDFSEYIESLRNGASAQEVIKSLFSSLIKDEGIMSAFSSRLGSMDSAAELVDFLNGLLEAMPDSELRDMVYDVLDETVRSLEEKDPYAQSQPKQSSSIQALTDFVEKNINHPALKSIDSFNASNLLQSMINAPGVMTPLAHYILPIQVEDTRAFGELWVDNNDDSGVAGGAAGGNHHHLFLTFDVDTYGRFEVDVYANDDTVTVSLLHPASFSRNAGSIIERINRIAASTKYTISDFKTGVLKEPHNLTQIFPKLSERRAGLNVKA